MNASDYAAKVARKFVSAGWTRTATSDAMDCSLFTANGLLGFGRRTRVEFNVNRVAQAEILPELRQIELHIVSQLVVMGFTEETIAEITGISIGYITGEQRRTEPDYQAIASLFALGNGRIQGISHQPSCIYTNCLARGEYLDLASGRFCPVHADNALRILKKQRVAA